MDLLLSKILLSHRGSEQMRCILIGGDLNWCQLKKINLIFYLKILGCSSSHSCPNNLQPSNVQLRCSRSRSSVVNQFNRKCWVFWPSKSIPSSCKIERSGKHISMP